MALEAFLKADGEATALLIDRLREDTLAVRTVLAEQRAQIRRLQSEQVALENRLADAEREAEEAERRRGSEGGSGAVDEQIRLLQALAEEERACAELRAELGL